MTKRKAESEKEKTGRVSKYVSLSISEQLESIQGWAKHGSTMPEIAKMLGVAESTIYEWKNAHPEFSKALRAGASVANGDILHAAFDQATGAYIIVKEIQKVKKQRWDNEAKRVLTDEVLETIEYPKYFPPDPRMTIFMLTNRLKDDYQAKVAAESAGGSIIVQHNIPSGDLDAKNNKN